MTDTSIDEAVEFRCSQCAEKMAREIEKLINEAEEGSIFEIESSDIADEMLPHFQNLANDIKSQTPQIDGVDDAVSKMVDAIYDNTEYDPCTNIDEFDSVQWANTTKKIIRGLIAPLTQRVKELEGIIKQICKSCINQGIGLDYNLIEKYVPELKEAPDA